ncbi:DUF1707 SHOCT-like domain-containing protein [Piscicoccus intestinalis]|uniref:DUF1707 SHOCT-like domain-containing protein n=1 Tax=Piscicoccus intestinalis TaxID=746033 RepID=UPI0008381F36|nr:DUF1707 domain-containing protein [Piscicoccus intestinalis]
MNQPQGDIGEAERAHARDRLDEQWRAGAIGPSEHERRVTQVRHAHTRAELDAAMEGLPTHGATGPVLASYEPPARATEATGAHAALERSERSDRTDGLIKLNRTTAYTIVSLTPFVCLILFFALNVPWWIFLAIPIVPILVYGQDGKNEAQAERRALRHERKARRHRAIAEKHRRTQR